MVRQLLTGIIFLFVIMISTNAQSKDEKAVTNTVEKLRIAMIDGNRSQLDQITSDKLSYGHSSGYVEGKTEFVEKIATGKSDFVTIELKDQTISVSGKAAVVRHILNATTNDNGKPGVVHLQILLVFQKENKRWKLLARQAVKVQQ